MPSPDLAPSIAPRMDRIGTIAISCRSRHTLLYTENGPPPFTDRNKLLGFRGGKPLACNWAMILHTWLRVLVWLKTGAMTK
jgi:hypothetical protein